MCLCLASFCTLTMQLKKLRRNHLWGFSNVSIAKNLCEALVWPSLRVKTNRKPRTGFTLMAAKGLLQVVFSEFPGLVNPYFSSCDEIIIPFKSCGSLRRLSRTWLPSLLKAALLVQKLSERLLKMIFSFYYACFLIKFLLSDKS